MCQVLNCKPCHAFLYNALERYENRAGLASLYEVNAVFCSQCVKYDV